MDKKIGMSLNPINALHLLPNETLLNFANICGTDVVTEDMVHSHTLGFIRSLEVNKDSRVGESQGREESIH